MATRTVTISSNKVSNQKPTIANVNTEKIVILPSRTILYGRTPAGIAKKTFASLASESGLAPAEFATRVLSMNLADKLSLLRNFYAQKSPEFRKLYDPLIAEAASSTSGQSQPDKRDKKPPTKKKRAPVKTSIIRKKSHVEDCGSTETQPECTPLGCALSPIPSPLEASLEEPRPPPETPIRPLSDVVGQATQIPPNGRPSSYGPVRTKFKRKMHENPFSFVQTQNSSELNPTETDLDSIFFTSTQAHCPQVTNSPSETQNSVAFELDEIFFTQRKRRRGDQTQKSVDTASVSLLSQVSTTEANETLQQTKKTPEFFTLIKPKGLWEPVSPKRSIGQASTGNTSTTIHERLILEGKLVPNDKRRTF